jgi:hypothetical protein
LEHHVIGPTVKTKIKKKLVVTRVIDKSIRVLYATSRTTQLAMQRSMRYRKKPSKPGEPPSAHKDSKRGPLVRKLTKFSVNERDLTSVTGPEISRGTPSEKPVPQTLNEGGRVKRRKLNKRVFQVGDRGPFRKGGKNFAGGVIKTEAQAERATRLVDEENAFRDQINQSSISGMIAPRPFATFDTPAFREGLTKIREQTEKQPL